MAELVQLNMEQMLPFLSELNKVFGSDYVREVVTKRKHFENKIASKKRLFNDFHSYLKSELNNYQFIKESKCPETKELLKNVKLLIDRILKQITIHFQNEPKAFLLAIQVYRSLHKTNIEQKYWELLLNKHGHKEVKLYLTAAYHGMHEMLNSDVFYEDHKKKNDLGVLIKQLKSVNVNSSEYVQIKKEMEKVEKDQEQAKIEAADKYRGWVRDVFVKAYNEFPDNKLLHIAYLKFEINTYQFQQKSTEDQRMIFGDCRDGRVLQIILQERLADIADVKFISEIVQLFDEYLPSFESSALDEMRQTVASSSATESEAMIVDESKPQETVTIDPFEYFNSKYPNPREIRCLSPKKVATDLVSYLESITTKMCSGEINKEVQLPKTRELMEWILNDDDWCHNYIDVWWQYYEMERRCGDYLKSLDVMQRAATKLVPDLQAVLTMRKIKSHQNN